MITALVACFVGGVVGVTIHAWLTERMWKRHQDEAYRTGFLKGVEAARAEHLMVLGHMFPASRREVPRG